MNEEITKELLDIVVSGMALELAGYCMTMLESDSLPHEERLVRVRELLNDMENAVIGASMQLTSNEDKAIIAELMQPHERDAWS